MKRFGAFAAALALIWQTGQGVVHELAGHEDTETVLSGVTLSHLFFGHDHSDGHLESSDNRIHAADAGECVLCHSISKPLSFRRPSAGKHSQGKLLFAALQDDRACHRIGQDAQSERGPPSA